MIGENLPRTSADKWRRGYRQHTLAFRQYLIHSKALSRVMLDASTQHAFFFRANTPRSNGPGPHSADQVRIERRTYGGFRGDRQEFRVVAYGQKNHKNASKTLKKALVFVSGDKKISRGGRIS